MKTLILFLLPFFCFAQKIPSTFSYRVPLVLSMKIELNYVDTLIQSTGKVIMGNLNGLPFLMVNDKVFNFTEFSYLKPYPFAGYTIKAASRNEKYLISFYKKKNRITLIMTSENRTEPNITMQFGLPPKILGREGSLHFRQDWVKTQHRKPDF